MLSQVGRMLISIEKEAPEGYVITLSEHATSFETDGKQIIVHCEGHGPDGTWEFTYAFGIDDPPEKVGKATWGFFFR